MMYECMCVCVCVCVYVFVCCLLEMMGHWRRMRVDDV
jgi:hypothetical protein